MVTVYEIESKVEKAPDAFSSELQVISLTNRDARLGIVLNGLDDLLATLEKFGEKIEATKSTSELLDNIRSQRKAHSDENMRHISGNIHPEFGDVVVVQAEKCDDKYVLRLQKGPPLFAGNNYHYDEDFAAELGRPQALYLASCSVKISPVGDWFNLDLEKILGNIPEAKGRASAIAEKIVLEAKERHESKVYRSTHPIQSVKLKSQEDFYYPNNVLLLYHEGKPVVMEIDVSGNMYAGYRKGFNDKAKMYLEARGPAIVGAAWDSSWDGRDEAKVKNPHLVLTFRDSHSLFEPLSFCADAQKIQAVQQARNYISNRIPLS